MGDFFIFGWGYVAGFVAEQLRSAGYRVFGTSRQPEVRSKSRFELFDFTESLIPVLSSSVGVLVCIPPQDGCDEVLSNFAEVLIKNKNLQWLGYLSSTIVYGDHSGDWVSEDSECLGDFPRAKARLAIEHQWLDLYSSANVPTHIFRLAAIYGPGRSRLDAVSAGVGVSLIKQGHLFSRIYVQDIVKAIMCSIAKPMPGEIFNVADDEPACMQTVDAYAAILLGMPPLQVLNVNDVQLSSMMKEFFRGNKRVSNSKLKRLLTGALSCRSYREGLHACLEAKSL